MIRDRNRIMCSPESIRRRSIPQPSSVVADYEEKVVVSTSHGDRDLRGLRVDRRVRQSFLG